MIDPAPNPRPGDFGLTYVDGFAGLAIRAGQWLNGDGFTGLEHAFLVLDKNQLVEAEPGGARIRPLTEYDPSSVVYSHWKLTDAQREVLATHGRQLAGTPYSALDYFALAAHRLHLPAPGLREFIADSGHMICSQLIDEVYRRSDLVMFTDDRWPGYVTPGMLISVLNGPV